MLDINTSNKYQIDPELQQNIHDFFKYFWLKDHSTLLNNNGFLMRMPLQLKNDFIDFLFLDEIEDFSAFFREYDHELKNNLMLLMYPRIFDEDTLILKNHERVEDVYIIRSGTVYLQNKFNNKFLSLSEKSFFGEEYILFNDVLEIDFVSDVSGVECFCLKKSKYLELLNQYPKTFECVLKRAFKRSKYFKAVMKVASKCYELDSSRLSMNQTDRFNANDYIESFKWELSEEETEELTRIILKNKEIDVKEKICESLNKNAKRIVSIQENLEKISNTVGEMKDYYENDIQNLINIVRLFEDGHILEANDLLSKFKARTPGSS